MPLAKNRNLSVHLAKVSIDSYYLFFVHVVSTHLSSAAPAHSVLWSSHISLASVSCLSFIGPLVVTAMTRAMGSPVTSGLSTLPCDLNHNPKGLWSVRITGETEQQLTMLGPQLIDYLYFFIFYLSDIRDIFWTKEFMVSRQHEWTCLLICLLVW